jgi:hypothetical protein
MHAFGLYANVDLMREDVMSRFGKNFYNAHKVLVTP